MSIRDHEEPEFEIKFYEGLIKKKPDFTEALSALGDLYTKNEMYEKGLVIDKKLLSLRPDDPIILYNLACSYSLLNDVDRALEAIQKAIGQGYQDYPYLERDEDLVNLRKDSRFQQYFLKLRSQPKFKKKNESNSE